MKNPYIKFKSREESDKNWLKIMKISFEKKTETDKCPSCGIKYIHHLGLIPTCKKLQKFNKDLKDLLVFFDGFPKVYIKQKLEKMLKTYEK